MVITEFTALYYVTYQNVNVRCRNCEKRTRRCESNANSRAVQFSVEQGVSWAASSASASTFLHLFSHIPASHPGTFDKMKGINIFLVFLVLSASLLCTSEAARSRTSNQNSFRRAANGIYQTLSSLFGEDNIKGLYKVRWALPFRFPKKHFCLIKRHVTPSSRLLACEQETSGLRPNHQFNECRFEISALSSFK